MQFKKISTKMLLIVLPLIIITQIILTTISSVSSYHLVEEKSAEVMIAELNYNTHSISSEFENIKTMAVSLASSVAHTYKQTSLPEYEKMLSDIIQTDEIVLGSGLWFAPYTYASNEKYVGPYVYKEGHTNITTYAYSNAEYDYFSQEYYITAMHNDLPSITTPYYDSTTGKIMATCSAPIILSGNRLGCVTVDVELSSIQNLVEKVKIGTSGTAFLITNDGTYLAGVDKEKIENAMSIVNDSNTTLAELGQTILSNEQGTSSYTCNGKVYNVYYSTLKGLGWKLAIQIDKYTLLRPVFLLINRLVILCIIATIVTVILIMLQLGSITKCLSKVGHFARNLASGDFTILPLNVLEKDELGQMSESLNHMYSHNKEVIGDISKHAETIHDYSTTLSSSASYLNQEFSKITTCMTTVNESMMTSSAATEELNASAEQVAHSIEILAHQTQQSLTLSSAIKERAESIDKSSEEAFAQSIQLKEQYELKLAESLEHAKVIQHIDEMAKMISVIAGQITLLSLNASIEAARAGESGKGFAVVATEIGKLAAETSEAVSNIQQTISDIQSAFENLSENTTSLLAFLSNTVTPDYRNFTNIAKQYGTDAKDISNFSQTISQMAQEIHTIIEEITHATQSISESTQDTANASSSIMVSVHDVSKIVEDVNIISTNQLDISQNLNSIVSKFKLNK